MINEEYEFFIAGRARNKENILKYVIFLINITFLIIAF